MKVHMKQRCVHIFPRFHNKADIEAIREKYDPLHSCIEPHITLVFPFESTLTKDTVVDAVQQAVSSESPFTLRATGISAVDNHGYYLFLNIEEGASRIKDLHYKLHEGALEAYQSPWTKDGSYKPHVTIGRFKTAPELAAAYEEVKSTVLDCTITVDRLYIEIIGENEESIIEDVVLFGRTD